MPRARRTPARTASTERAAPKATADGTAQNSISRGLANCGTVTIDGIVNANTSSAFEHFNSAVSGNTWTLTHK